MMNLPRRGERGAVAMIVAVSAVALFVFAALVVELGLARDTRRQAQNGADAAALAAANKLYDDLGGVNLVAAVDEAKQYALENYGVPLTAWGACTDSAPGGYQPAAGETGCVTFSPNLTRPLEVRVRIPNRDVETPFGGLADVDSVTVGAIAHARVAPGGASDCGLCVLGEGMTHDIQNGDTRISGADIHFNGNVDVGPNGLVATNGEITVEGSADGPPDNYEPPAIPGADPIDDPLAGLPLPPDMTGLVPRTNPCNHGPGIYSGYNFRNTVCTLTPGLYVIAGGSGAVWDLAGNSSTNITATGVTLYFTCGTPASVRACNPGEAGASLDLSGNGVVNLSAPTSGPLKGFTIVYDRNNRSDMRLTGNGGANVTGTIYMASATLDMRGNGCSRTFNALIVINSLAFSGNNTCLQSNYDVNQNVQVPRGDIFLSR